MRFTDEEYVFRKDIAEKKSIGRGAFHKKCGAKSKKCTLPHEYLTKKERERLNGECKTYDLRSFMTWHEFFSLPDDLKVNYINSLINRFDCNLSAISEYVFKQKPSRLANWIAKWPLRDYINTPPKGKRKGNEALLKAVKEAEESKKEIQNGSEEPIGTVTKKAISRDGMKIDVALTENGKEFFDRLERDANYPEVTREESTNISDFYVVMDKLDFGFMASVRDMFEGKKIRVTLRVEIDE